jgi:hypothetical protein
MKAIVTFEELEAIPACQKGLGWFKRFYPDEAVDWSPEGIRRFFAVGGGEWYSWAYRERLLPALSFADLSGANLYCADLRFANLGYANLYCADLRCANLSGADLRDADLSGWDLDDLRQRGAII